MIVRRAAPTAEDAAVVAELNVVVQQLHFEHRPDHFLAPEADAFAPVVQDWLRSDNVRAFIAEDDGKPVGYVLAILHERPASPLTRPSKIVELDHIAVLPTQRCNGVGRRLADEVFGFAREVDADAVALSVWEFNESAQAFFRELGFAPEWHRMAAPLR